MTLGYHGHHLRPPTPLHTVFLGVELGTIDWLAKLPMDKLTEYKEEVEQTLSCKIMCHSELEPSAEKLSAPISTQIFQLDQKSEEAVL